MEEIKKTMDKLWIMPEQIKNTREMLAKIWISVEKNSSVYDVNLQNALIQFQNKFWSAHPSILDVAVTQDGVTTLVENGYVQQASYGILGRGVMSVLREVSEAKVGLNGIKEELLQTAIAKNSALAEGLSTEEQEEIYDVLWVSPSTGFGSRAFVDVVQRFQHDNGLTADGWIGKNGPTRWKLTKNTVGPNTTKAEPNNQKPLSIPSEKPTAQSGPALSEKPSTKPQARPESNVKPQTAIPAGWNEKERKEQKIVLALRAIPWLESAKLEDVWLYFDGSRWQLEDTSSLDWGEEDSDENPILTLRNGYEVKNGKIIKKILQNSPWLKPTLSSEVPDTQNTEEKIIGQKILESVHKIWWLEAATIQKLWIIYASQDGWKFPEGLRFAYPESDADYSVMLVPWYVVEGGKIVKKKIENTSKIEKISTNFLNATSHKTELQKIIPELFHDWELINGEEKYAGYRLVKKEGNKTYVEFDNNNNGTSDGYDVIQDGKIIQNGGTNFSDSSYSRLDGLLSTFETDGIISEADKEILKNKYSAYSEVSSRDFNFYLDNPVVEKAKKFGQEKSSLRHMLYLLDKISNRDISVQDLGQYTKSLKQELGDYKGIAPQIITEALYARLGGFRDYTSQTNGFQKPTTLSDLLKKVQDTINTPISTPAEKQKEGLQSTDIVELRNFDGYNVLYNKWDTNAAEKMNTLAKLYQDNKARFDHIKETYGKPLTIILVDSSHWDKVINNKLKWNQNDSWVNISDSKIVGAWNYFDITPTLTEHFWQKWLNNWLYPGIIFRSFEPKNEFDNTFSNEFFESYASSLFHKQNPSKHAQEPWEETAPLQVAGWYVDNYFENNPNPINLGEMVKQINTGNGKVESGETIEDFYKGGDSGQKILKDLYTWKSALPPEIMSIMTSVLRQKILTYAPKLADEIKKIDFVFDPNSNLLKAQYIPSQRPVSESPKPSQGKTDNAAEL